MNLILDREMRSLAPGSWDPAEGPQESDWRVRRHHGSVHQKHHAGAQEGADYRGGGYEDDIKTLETISSHSGVRGDTSIPGIHQGKERNSLTCWQSTFSRWVKDWGTVCGSAMVGRACTSMRTAEIWWTELNLILSGKIEINLNNFKPWGHYSF